jgi:hypothetical protein
MKFMSKEGKEKSIVGFVKSETAAAGKRVAETEAAVERERISVLKRAAAGTTKMTFEEMLEAIGDSVDNVATSDEEDNDEDNEEDGEDNNDAKLGNGNEPEWVVDTINQSVPAQLDLLLTKEMNFVELTTLGSADAENDFRTCDRKYITTKLKIQAVVTLNAISDTANASKFHHFMDTLIRVPATTSPMAQPTTSP